MNKKEIGKLKLRASQKLLKETMEEIIAISPGAEKKLKMLLLLQDNIARCRAENHMKHMDKMDRLYGSGFYDRF